MLIYQSTIIDTYCDMIIHELDISELPESIQEQLVGKDDKDTVWVHINTDKRSIVSHIFCLSKNTILSQLGDPDFRLGFKIGAMHGSNSIGRLIKDPAVLDKYEKERRNNGTE